MKRTTGQTSSSADTASPDEGLERPHFFDLITGSPGTGKTWLLLHQARLYQVAGWQVVYLSIADDRLPNHPGILEAYDFDNALDLAENYENVVFCIDEFPDYLPAGERPDPRLVKILRLRRHVRFSILATAQCPWDINVRGRKLWNRVYFFELPHEGEQWLEREGCPDVNPPAGRYGLFDRAQREVKFVPFKINSDDWR